MEHEPIFLNALAVWRHPPEGTKGKASPRDQGASPKARVLIVHGISEHSGRHLNTVHSLTAHGYEVIRFDLRGAGMSGGRRQWVKHFDDYVADMAAVYNWICRELDELPLFILGHSLGGAISTHFAALYSGALRGVVLSAPAFRVGSAISPVAIVIGKALAHLAPAVCLPKSTDASSISRDPDVCAAYLADPLACHNNTLQQGTEILRALALMPERCASIHAPILFCHGSDDRIIKLEGSFELVRCAGAGDKTLHVMPGGYHELHNDLDKEEYFALLLTWLDKHV